MPSRSNEEWLTCLTGSPDRQAPALADLRGVLEKAALFYVKRSPIGAGLTSDQVQAAAEDVSQEATLLVLAKLATFRGEARFVTWASSFAIRIARTAMQRRAWRNLSLDRSDHAWQEAEAVVSSTAGWQNPQQALQRRAIWDVINDVVQKDLTDRQREMLDLVVLQGVSTEQVTEHLQTTASAMYKAVHDARRRLKAGLLKRGFTTAEILDAFAANG
jgi:RNA polymerase sigma-70 factor (ECF subfamily)